MLGKELIVFCFYFNGPPLGVAVHTRELLRELIPLLVASDYEIKVKCSSDAYRYLSEERVLNPYLVHFPLYDRVVSRFVSLIFQGVERSLHRRRKVVFVMLTNPVASLISFKFCRTISVVHDLNEFDESCKYGYWKSLFRRVQLWYSAKKSDFIVCASDHARRQFSMHLPNVFHKIEVILNGPGNSLAIMPREVSRQILVVGRIDPVGKNLYRAYEVVRQWLQDDASMEVVFVGGINESTRTEAEQFLKLISTTDRMRYQGQVSDQELAVHYSESEFLLFLSKLEGFGMPPFEALRAHCPVIASNGNAVLRDVINVGIVFLDEDVAPPPLDAIRSAINDVQWGEVDEEIGKYSWSNAARAYLSLINRIIE